MTDSEKSFQGTSKDAQIADQLLSIVREVAIELHPDLGGRLRVGMDSRLEADLGFDSLGTAELLTRLEGAFDIHLEPRLLSEVQTIRDWYVAVLAAETGRIPLGAMTLSRPVLGPVESVPEAAKTLIEVLDWHTEKNPNQTHIILWDGVANQQTITYQQLSKTAKLVAQGLLDWGIEPGDRVGIMLPTSADFFTIFFGVLMAGGVPVPIYPPMRMAQIEDHMKRQAGILANAQVVLLITIPEAITFGNVLRASVSSMRGVKTVTDVIADQSDFLAMPGNPDHMALIQYTSGSTGDPKGVILSHRNMLSNIRAMCTAVKARSSDIFVSWLPLYHDMGLIGAWLGCLYYATPTVIMSPLVFLARPARWLWAIHHFEATLTAAPNFAYELCVNKTDPQDLEGLSLKSLRMSMNGAEPVSADTVRRFTQKFQPYGFRPEVMAPVYGLAENSVGLAFPSPGTMPEIDCIAMEPLVKNGKAIVVSSDDSHRLEVVSCGRPIPGHQIRIIDSTGHEVGDRQEGRLQFLGPSSTSGYFRDPEKNKKLFDKKWVNTGDLAYRVGGKLFITSRAKDIIIRAGRNIHPHETEEIVGRVKGIRKGCACVIGVPDPKLGTERVIVLAETRRTDKKALKRLKEDVQSAAAGVLEGPADEVLLGPPHSIPKTSSGKVRRAAARSLYLEGHFGAAGPAVWRQMAVLYWGGFVSNVRQFGIRLGAYLYAGYWWALLCFVGTITWLLVTCLPHPKWRWGIVHTLSKGLLTCWGIKLSIEGDERSLPPPGIIVANHSSYLDGLILVAAFKSPMVFVAKRELAQQFVAGNFLRRLNTVFVERDEGESSLEDTKAVEAVAKHNHVLFFPEATLTRMPGVLPFRLGAFSVAANLGCDVVPITIKGTRFVLRGDGQWFPKRGNISVHISDPIHPIGSDLSAAVACRDQARKIILAQSGELDLAHP